MTSSTTANGLRPICALFVRQQKKEERRRLTKERAKRDFKIISFFSRTREKKKKEWSGKCCCEKCFKKLFEVTTSSLVVIVVESTLVWRGGFKECELCVGVKKCSVRGAEKEEGSIPLLHHQRTGSRAERNMRWWKLIESWISQLPLRFNSTSTEFHKF